MYGKMLICIDYFFSTYSLQHQRNIYSLFTCNKEYYNLVQSKIIIKYFQQTIFKLLLPLSASIAFSYFISETSTLFTRSTQSLTLNDDKKLQKCKCFITLQDFHTVDHIIIFNFTLIFHKQDCLQKHLL